MSDVKTVGRPPYAIPQLVGWWLGVGPNRRARDPSLEALTTPAALSSPRQARR